MNGICKKIIIFLLTAYFIFVPRDALAANVKLPININVSGTNPVYYRYELNISKLDSNNNAVSNTVVPVFLRRNGTLIYDFGDFYDLGEYKYSVSLANADNEKFEFDRRNYIVHIQALTNGRDIYTNTYLEDPAETAKPASLDFNVKYLVEIVYPNGNSDSPDTGDDNRYSKRSDKKDSADKKGITEKKRFDNKENTSNLIDIERDARGEKTDKENVDLILDAARGMKKSIVNTGDKSLIEFYTVLFFISICIFILLFFRRRKNHP